MNLLEVAQHDPYHTITSIHTGVLEEECGSVLVHQFSWGGMMKTKAEQMKIANQKG
jgi:hypothetical protein